MAQRIRSALIVFVSCRLLLGMLASSSNQENWTANFEALRMFLARRTTGNGTEADLALLRQQLDATDTRTGCCTVGAGRGRKLAKASWAIVTLVDMAEECSFEVAKLLAKLRRYREERLDQPDEPFRQLADDIIQRLAVTCANSLNRLRSESLGRMDPRELAYLRTTFTMQLLYVGWTLNQSGSSQLDFWRELLFEVLRSDEEYKRRQIRALRSGQRQPKRRLFDAAIKRGLLEPCRHYVAALEGYSHLAAAVEARLRQTPRELLARGLMLDRMRFERCDQILGPIGQGFLNELFFELGPYTAMFIEPAPSPGH